jgi:hypothetical protein
MISLMKNAVFWDVAPWKPQTLRFHLWSYVMEAVTQ